MLGSPASNAFQRVAELGKGKDRDGKGGGKSSRGNLVERGAEGVVVSKKEKFGFIAPRTAGSDQAPQPTPFCYN